MDILLLLQASMMLLLAIVGLLGLLVGSFLNVIIYRLPIMMQAEWRRECHELLQLPTPAVEPQFNLCVPRSQCPHCQQPIRSKDNIPLLSYLLLRGKCRACQQPISPRYPLIEIITSLLSVIVIYHFGATIQGFSALLLTWALIASAMIDYDHTFIPDSITLPMLWLGLLLNVQHVFVALPDAVIGAAAAYCTLWLFTKVFYLATGKVGMGNGDFKLFALFGAWFGWSVLPFILVASSLIGAIVGSFILWYQQSGRDTQIPFGPYLVAAGWVAMLWGQSFNQFYLQLITT